jgi:hypothetical protein
MRKLSAAQELTISRLAAPLQRGDRAHFRELVAKYLAAEREIGDGTVARCAAAAQREVLSGAASGPRRRPDGKFAG